jgi:hypothetical protein
MIEAQIEQLRTLVSQAGGLPESTRSEILQRLDAVKAESAGVATAPQDDIPAVTQTARALGRLAGAVEGLEASHPQITAMVNRIATALANIGI